MFARLREKAFIQQILSKQENLGNTKTLMIVWTITVSIILFCIQFQTIVLQFLTIFDILYNNDFPNMFCLHTRELKSLTLLQIKLSRFQFRRLMQQYLVIQRKLDTKRDQSKGRTT